MFSPEHGIKRDIPEGPQRQLKASAALEGRSVVDGVETMIRDYVRGVKAGRKV